MIRPTSTLAIALVAAGACATASGAGDLDPTFAAGAGYATFAIGSGDLPNDQAVSVLVGSQGRIVVSGFRTSGTGEVDRDMAVLRLLEDGSPDPAFNGGSPVIVQFDLGGFHDSADRILERDDGRYVLCGIAEDEEGDDGTGQFALARLLESGGLDTSFDLDGRRNFALYPGGTDTNLSGDCALAPDGSVVVAGTALNNSTFELHLVLARVLNDGSLDTGFGDAGIAAFNPFSASMTPLAIATATLVLPDGDILVAGYGNHSTTATPNLDMFVARLDPDGSLDASFGEDGVRLVAFDQGGDNSDVASALALAPDGRIVLAGEATVSGGGVDVALVRLTPSGHLDSSFGTGGRALIGYDAGGDLEDRAGSVVVDDTGRLLVAGQVSVGDDNVDAAVLRVLPEGLPDTSYGDAGWRAFGIDNSPAFDSEFLRSIALDESGRAVAAGGAYLGPTTLDFDFLVMRLTSGQVFADGFESAD